MQFSINKIALQKELGFVQGIVERKNTIPALSNILIESVGGSTIRITGTDLDVIPRYVVQQDTPFLQSALTDQPLAKGELPVPVPVTLERIGSKEL